MTIMKWSSFVLLLASASACQDQTIATPAPATAATPGDEDAAAPPVTTKPDASTPDSGTVIPPAALCTNTFGNGLTAGHGRLDGTIRAVVVPSDKKCQSDDDHVMLQVDVVVGEDTVTYPIAVNILSDQQTGDPDVRFGRSNHALVGPAWSPGWHTDADLDYATSLGVHDPSFAATPPVPLSTTLASELKVGARVSVYGYGYAGGDGEHKIHRNGVSDDGAIVLVGATPSWLLFHFSQQTF